MQVAEAKALALKSMLAPTRSIARGERMVVTREKTKPQLNILIPMRRKMTRKGRNINHMACKNKHATNMVFGDISPRYAGHQSILSAPTKQRRTKMRRISPWPSAMKKPSWEI